MKKSLKIFALAASLLQAAIFSAFAANPPSDFTYELINNNQALKITGVKNNKAEYVVPASIEDFPVTEVHIYYRKENAISPYSISFPEGCVIVSIDKGKSVNSVITVRQLPSTVKELSLYNCKYNGTVPTGIEVLSIVGTGKDIKLNQNLSELKNLKGLQVDGSLNDHINLTLDDLSELQNLDRLMLQCVDVASKAPLKNALLEYVNLTDNKTVYINNDEQRVRDTNAEELIFEEGVTKIKLFSVEGNKNLKRIVLPSTLQSVESEIFSDCPNLSEVVVPDSLIPKKVKITTKVQIKGEFGRYRYPRNVADIFDTTSLPLKNQARLNEMLVY